MCVARMLRRITLVNYMAHAHTVIDLAEGLTVLVGPNNCGKSAVVEALRSLCFNEGGDYMVRHGQRLCEVTVETDDGHVLTWRRKDNQVSYVVDGNEMHRLGKGGVPEELHRLLRLGEVVTASGESFDVHFGMQKEPIFLLGRAVERRAADFFSASSDAEKLMEMQKLHKRKVRDAQIRRKALAEELALTTSRLAALAQLDQIEPAMEAAEREHAAIISQESRLEELAESIQLLQRMMEQAQAQAARCEALRRLAPPPELADESAAALLLDRLDRAARDVERERSRCELLGRLQPPPPQHELTALEMLVRDMTRLYRNLDTLRRGAHVLSPLAEPPQPIPTAALEQLIAAWDATRKSAAAHEAEIRNIDAQLREVEQGIFQWARSHPTCPVCGAPVEPQRLLERGHAHV